MPRTNTEYSCYRSRWVTRVAALLFFTSPTWAAIYTAAGNSQWGNASAWSPAGVPGAGDTVNIPDGITITLNQNVTIGNSSQGGLGPHRGPHSSIAISLNNSGQLVLAQGALLILRGDIVYNAANCTNTSNAVVMQAGSTLEFDSSAGSPRQPGTHYSFGPTGNGGCREFARPEPRDSGIPCFPIPAAGRECSRWGNVGSQRAVRIHLHRFHEYRRRVQSRLADRLQSTAAIT